MSRAVEESLSSHQGTREEAEALLHEESGADFDVTETVRELEEEMLDGGK